MLMLVPNLVHWEDIIDQKTFRDYLRKNNMMPVNP